MAAEEAFYQGFREAILSSVSEQEENEEESDKRIQFLLYHYNMIPRNTDRLYSLSHEVSQHLQFMHIS